MDRCSGYDQIKVHLEDLETTAFQSPKGVSCYQVMPFGSKNMGTTFQRAMTTIFKKMLGDTVNGEAIKSSLEGGGGNYEYKLVR